MHLQSATAHCLTPASDRDSLTHPQRQPALARRLLANMMSWDREIFADFVVEPLTPQKPGVMQIVRVAAASKFVVTEKNKVVSRKDAL